MLFWILLTLAILIIVGEFINGCDDDGVGWGVGLAFLATIFCAVGGGLLMLLAFWLFGTSYVVTGTDHHDLRALGNGPGIEGKFYLGSGYIGSTQEFSYLTQDGDATRLGGANADYSVVYEDGGKTVTVTHSEQINNWLAPWGFPNRDQYAFHVPAGAVKDNYTVSTGTK